MSAKSRGEVLAQGRWRYQGRGKQGRSRLLGEICALRGFERTYASKILSGQRAIAGSGGRRRGGSQAIYGEAERVVIKAIWCAAEQPCGKRLKAALGLWLPYYEKREGALSEAVRSNVLALGAATHELGFSAINVQVVVTGHPHVLQKEQRRRQRPACRNPARSGCQQSPYRCGSEG